MIDFGLTEAQSLLQRSARAALREESPPVRVREWQRSPIGYDEGVYRHHAELGWLGLLVPEALGGQDRAWVEAILLYEEFGRSLLPGPHFAAMLAAQLITRFGSDTQQAALVPGITAGDRTVAPAIWERSARSSLRHLETRASLSGGEYLVSGEKRAVEFGHVVDELLVAATVADGGFGLFLIDRAATGVESTAIESLGGEPRALVTLTDVRVPADRVIALAEADLATFDSIMLQMRLLRASELIGCADAALELAKSYAVTRVQYGRPIGAFQAIQHKLADCATRVELARWPVLYAAWLLAEGTSADDQVAGAILKAGEAAREVTAESVQVHGGLGVIDGSDISLYYRAAKGRQLELGYPDLLRERIAVGLGL